MYDHCKKILLLLSAMISMGNLSVSAASLRWVHLGTIESGMAGMAIDGKIAYRKMPPGKATPWGKVTPGAHRFQIASGENSGANFELEIAEGQKITLVSVSDDNGDIQCRTFGLEKAQGEIFVLNMLPGTAISVPESKQRAIMGKGFWLPDVKAKTAVSLVDSEGFTAELDFSRLGDKAQSPYLAVICRNDDAKPNLAILRDQDSLLEMSDESIEIRGELKAGIRIISESNKAAPGSFDPSGVDWAEVDSRIFWLNLSIDRDPCRLDISGFPALRRMPSGRGSGFLTWPAGDWETAIVVERTNEKLSGGNFTLAAKASTGLISSGGGKYPHRLLTLKGRSRQESGSKVSSQIRFMNALPDGVIKAAVSYDPTPRTVTLNPGETSEIIPLENVDFPGATIHFTIGVTYKLITKIPLMRSMPQGDWVVVIHLDKESFASPVLTWVEMDKGAITFPTTQTSGE